MFTSNFCIFSDFGIRINCVSSTITDLDSPASTSASITENVMSRTHRYINRGYREPFRSVTIASIQLPPIRATTYKSNILPISTWSPTRTDDTSKSELLHQQSSSSLQNEFAKSTRRRLLYGIHFSDFLHVNTFSFRLEDKYPLLIDGSM